MFKLSIQKPINYIIKIGLLYVLLLSLLGLIAPIYVLFSLLIIAPILTLVNFILFKKNNKDLKFEDYIKSGFIFSIIIALYTAFFMIAYEGYDLEDFFDFSRFPTREQHAPYAIFIVNIIFSSLLSVFFPKGTIKEKLGNLVKVVLFVIIIYNFIKSFIGGDDEEEEVGFDTDGDGKIDTTFIDTDGDGISETIAQDTDGDGIIDKISSDTDGDGLIDTVVADTDGDGLADTIIKDVDLDGDGKSDFRITKRKGKGLT